MPATIGSVGAMMGSRRRRAVALLAAAAVLTLGACSATEPIQTLVSYDASDGVGTSLGEMSVSNLMILTTAEGQPGRVLGGVTNRGGETATLTLLLDGVDEDLTFTVPGGETLLLDPVTGEDVLVAATPAAPGATVPVALSTPRAGVITLDVPVLDGTLSEYAPLVPTAAPINE